jgi:hypothetical protein
LKAVCREVFDGFTIKLTRHLTLNSNAKPAAELVFECLSCRAASGPGQGPVVTTVDDDDDDDDGGGGGGGEDEDEDVEAVNASFELVVSAITSTALYRSTSSVGVLPSHPGIPLIQKLPGPASKPAIPPRAVKWTCPRRLAVPTIISKVSV